MSLNCCGKFRLPYLSKASHDSSATASSACSGEQPGGGGGGRGGGRDFSQCVCALVRCF